LALPYLVIAPAQEEVEAALEYSNNMLVCFGQDTASPFRERLLKKIREPGRARLIPVLLPGDNSTQALRNYGLEEIHASDLRNWPDPEQVELLIRSLKTRAKSQMTATPDSPTRNPYPSAKPYSEDDAAFFFGREDEIRRAIDALKEHEVVLLQGQLKSARPH
jgi:hypothetical protein